MPQIDWQQRFRHGGKRGAVTACFALFRDSSAEMRAVVRAVFAGGLKATRDNVGNYFEVSAAKK